MKNLEILPYPEIKPITDTAKRLVVFLHGLGSDGHDLISLAPLMQDALPDCHFISPHAVQPFDMAPYGRQWFSLNNRTLEKMQQLIIPSAELLTKIIVDKQQQLNLTNCETIIIGFSQGTMIGLYLTLMQAQPFASMIGFSGKLINPAACLNKKTPICLIHGDADEVVDISEMSNIVDYLAKHNIKYSSLTVPNLTHSIDASGIEYALKFISDSTEV